jgi:hypothetical protein
MTCCGKGRPGSAREDVRFARRQGGGHLDRLPHARRFDELLRGVVQDTARAASCVVDVQ